MSIFKHHTRTDGHGTISQDPHHGAQNTVQAPEMSSQGLIPAVLLLLGALAVLFGKKRRGAQ